MIARMTAEHGGYDSAALRQAIRNINRAQIAQTFDHELAHYEHEQRLPVAWLMEWQQVVDQEQLNLTDYVHNMRSDDPSNHGDPDAEDLAETAALYLNEPWSLLTAAPMRFDIFNRRDGRYSQALLAEADALLQQYGANSSNVKMLDAMLVGRVEAPPAPKTVGPAPIEMDAA
jgi:hypothetical protein